jgi:hypothetical protein
MFGPDVYNRVAQDCIPRSERIRGGLCVSIDFVLCCQWTACPEPLAEDGKRDGTYVLSINRFFPSSRSQKSFIRRSKLPREVWRFVSAVIG